jgi:deazaflavin-dependent oxidoreductase (nitroreductase family)
MSEPGYTPPDLSLFGDDHVRQYSETDGVVGHEWNGVPTLVLTTVGRRSGAPRRSAMIYGRDGDAYVTIASQGGAPSHPNWYFNLAAHAEVDVQVRPDRFHARARTAEGDERERLWALMADLWPNYDVYARRTDRRIPVVVLERAP